MTAAPVDLPLAGAPVAVLACRGCASHVAEKHALADQDARTRRELAWSQIDLAKALDRGRADAETITPAVVTKTRPPHHRYAPGIGAFCVAMVGALGCGRIADDPAHIGGAG